VIKDFQNHYFNLCNYVDHKKTFILRPLPDTLGVFLG